MTDFVIIKSHQTGNISIIPNIDKEPSHLIVENWQRIAKNHGELTGCTSQCHNGNLTTALEIADRL